MSLKTLPLIPVSIVGPPIERDLGNPARITLNVDKYSYSAGETVSITGRIISDNEVEEGKVNQLIVVEALSDGKVIYNSTTTTDEEDNFSTSFQVAEEGTVTITARAVDMNNGQTSTTTISIVKPEWSLVITIMPIIAALALMILSPYKYLQILFLISIGLTVLSYRLLYYFKPLDETGNAALAAAFLAPIAAYVFEYIKKRRESEEKLESAVGDYRNTHLKTEVENLIKFANEISKHEAIFKAKHDFETSKLPDNIYKETNTVGTMANLPGLRLNRYYRYVGSYNQYLTAKINKTGELGSNAGRYDEFVVAFKELKDAYSDLNRVIYVNVLYAITEIQTKFLSFPTVEFPARITSPLIDMLVDATVLADRDETPTPKIYELENARKLMRKIQEQFETAYCGVEKAIAKLNGFTIS